jgi:hypothetical protein
MQNHTKSVGEFKGIASIAGFTLTLNLLLVSIPLKCFAMMFG